MATRYLNDLKIEEGDLQLQVGSNAAPQSYDKIHIGGDGLASSDAAIYIGNRGDGSGYGYRMYYYGTGSGNNNKLIFKSENLGSPVDMLSFTADGNATFSGTITTGSHGTSANWKQAYDNYITGIGVSGTSTKTITLTQRDGGTISTTFTDQSGSGGITMSNGVDNRVVTATSSTNINGESGLLFGGSYLEITPGDIATPLHVKRTSASTRQVNLLLSANDGSSTSEGFLGCDSSSNLRWGASGNTSLNSLILTEDNTDFVVNSSTNNAIIRLAGGGTNFTSFNIGGEGGAVTINSGSNSLTVGLEEFIEEKYIYTSNDSNAVYMPMVKGGMYATTSSSITGQILIKIPAYKADMMQQFYVDIYDYSTGESMTFKISGYSYSDTNATWHNTSVVNLSDDTDRDFTVRFGADTTNSFQYVAIGETNSTWNYPQINVRDFYGGYATSENDAKGSFNVSFVTTTPGSVSRTHTGNFVAGDYNNLKNTPTIPTVNNGTLTVQGTGALGGSGTFTANQSGNTTISISHDDTSSQGSVDNSNGTVIQDVTLDGYGHVTALGSVNLDGRYYTESESDSRFVNVTGDTMTGDLTISSSGVTGFGKIHYGVNGTMGQTTSWNPNSNNPGLWIEADNNESGGVFMNGNTFALWSPGDDDILKIYDEDGMPTGTPKFRITGSGLAVGYSGFSSDVNARNYTWRALENTGSSSNQYYRIARITASQSTRFIIELAGRSTSYSDGSLPAFGKIVGQLNNDNNYDIVYYNASATDEVVDEVGQVDVGTSSTDIYIRVGQFAELVATGSISDGTITPYEGDSASASAPTNYVQVTEYKLWNQGNDGSGSGLDADTVDGIEGASFLRSDTSDTAAGQITFNQDISVGAQTGTWITSNVMSDAIGWNTSYGVYIGSNVGGTHYLRGNGTFTTGGSTYNLWHEGNDGAGSGLDADTVDGVEVSRIVYGSGSRKTTNADPNSNTAMNSGFYDIYQTNAPSATWYSYITMAHTNTANEHGHQIAGSFYSDGDLFNRHYDGTNASFGNWTRIWNEANDGAGSGLDADKLDAQHGSYYLDYNNFSNTPTIPSGSSLVRVYQNQNYVASSSSTSNRGNFGAGLTVYEGYSSGTNRPHTYDTTLQIMSTTSQGFEISADWVSSSSTPLKVRSLRDCCQGWSPWINIWTEHNFTGTNISNWNTAYGWGNHASAGYLTGSPTSITIGGILLEDSSDRSGLLEINQKGSSAWSGIQIVDGSNRWSFMGNNSDVGIYDDANGEWVLLYNVNAATELYYNGSRKFQTKSNGIDITGGISSTGSWNYTNGTYGTQTLGYYYGAAYWYNTGLAYYIGQVTGTSTTQNKLYVRGAISVGSATASSTYGRIDASNDIVAYSSDKRLKENILPINSALDKISKLSGFTYNWNEKAKEEAAFNTEERLVGVFAQDVQEVLPEAVKIAPFDNDGNDVSKSGENYLTVQYEKIVPLLIEGIKEQQAQIEELTTILEKVTKQLNNGNNI